MTREIYFRLFLNTKDKIKAKKMSDKILKSLSDAKQVSLESYWKDKTLFNLEIRQNILSELPDEIIFEVLSKVSQISNSWSLDLPINFNSESYDISGITENNFKFNYISWGSFSVQEKNISIMDIVED